MKLRTLVTIAFIFSIQFLSAQPTDLDAKKWANELSKKDRDTYDSFYQLITQLEKVDSVKAFQFLDELAEKGRSKGDHFQALFNCLRLRSFITNLTTSFTRIDQPP